MACPWPNAAWFGGPAWWLLAGALILARPGVAGPLAAAGADPSDPCPAEQARRAAAPPNTPPPNTTPPNPTPPPDPLGPGPGPTTDYRERLQAGPYGWVHRPHWCVWVEPADSTGTATAVEQRWRAAVEAALVPWQGVVPLTLVSEPERAQVRVRRQRPPLRREANGRQRASHGRALLEVGEVQRRGQWQLEPQVVVLISPGQRQAAIQATALHELGHAFGLWGHSDNPADAMAAQPGPLPILQLSARDRASLGWLLRQPSRFAPP